MMLEGARIPSGNRHTYAIFLDNDLIYSEWREGAAQFCLFS